ncbi:glycoside hydrolase superfamily [Cunninghamella echinulata]|nr:glycoside hydrolase superfamily [Cunninghamella echinulata]
MIPLKDALTTHNAIINIEYNIQNQHFNLTTRFIDSSVSNEHITIKKKQLFDGDSFELNYIIEVENIKNIKLKRFEILFNTDFSDQSMMAEGFQSWSQTKEVDETTTLRSIKSAAAWVTKLDLQGDYNFFKYSNKQGIHHSTGYTYLRDTKDDTHLFIGSLTESNGYSYFKADFKKNHFIIYKDIEGKILAAGEKMEFCYFITQHDNGDQNILWQRYTNRYLPTINVDPNDIEKLPSFTGYTSWNTYSEGMTEKDILNNVYGFKKHGYPLDLILIDDGYQSAIGDWLDIDCKKFPHGMKYLVDEIKKQTVTTTKNNGVDNGYKKKNMLAGIWLAPFAVGLNSKINKEHPDWLVYDPHNGKPYSAGLNWGGFGVLDIYHPEVRNYLQEVFDTVIDEWKFQFLKLDFIFVAAMVPRLGKSRGEIMWDAVSLLQELTNKRVYLLGSGVSLPSVWGRLDFSRVSSDTSHFWDNSVLRLAHIRERAAISNALISTIHRWVMNDRMFGSDPDVFFIRSFKNQPTIDERFTLVTINNLLGKIALTPDNVEGYTKDEHALYAQLFPKVIAKVQSVKPIGSDVYQIHFISNGRPYITYTNLSSQPFSFNLPISSLSKEETIYFEHKNILLSSENNIDNDNKTINYKNNIEWHKVTKRNLHQPPLLLRSHQTRTFMEIVDDFVGSTGHLISGWELESIIKDGQPQNLIYIKLREPRTASNAVHIYFKASSTYSEDHIIFINDKKINDIQILEDESVFPILQLTYSP